MLKTFRYKLLGHPFYESTRVEAGHVPEKDRVAFVETILHHRYGESLVAIDHTNRTVTIKGVQTH